MESPSEEAVIIAKETVIDSLFIEVIRHSQKYGWFILGAVLLCWYICSRVRDYLRNINSLRAEDKDPTLYSSDKEKLRRIRDSMQEKYNQEAKKYYENLEKKKKMKFEEELKKAKVRGGQKLGSKPTRKDDTDDHRGYLPLMGGGMSGSYRPPRRSACSRGGGCG